jgi:multidrug efflux system outer membrane protein
MFINSEVKITLYLIICLPLLFACSLGPEYRKPDAKDITPHSWSWKLSGPKDAAPKGTWWKVFRDPELDRLEAAATLNNQTLRSAMARVDKARAIARISRSRLFPELSFDPSYQRERTSGNQPTPIPVKLSPRHLNSYSIPLDLSYEVDLWGRVRKSFEAANYTAQAAASDYQNAILTLTADVAVNYYLARSLDTEISAMKKAVSLREDSLRLQKERFLAGAIAKVDVFSAMAELSSVRAELSNTMRRRAELLNALALLCGKAAGSVNLEERRLEALPPSVPAGLPSDLLERRPDIARAERNLATANAGIGAAKAAYFPVLHLTGQAGYLSADAASLLSGYSRVWSIGPSVSLPLFNNGRITADVNRAEAQYEESFAEYRQTVLTAFKEVEDSLAQIVYSGEEYAADAEALAAAGKVSAFARSRYEVGAASYFEVIDAEQNTLLHERRLAEVTGKRFVAAIRLIKALGGGW